MSRSGELKPSSPETPCTLHNPFNGVETYLFDTEKEAEAIIDKLAREHPEWKFATEPLIRWPS